MPQNARKRYSRFNVGSFMKKRKEAREQVAASHRLIKEEIHKLEANQLKLRRLHCKMDEVNSHVTTLEEGLQETTTGQSNGTFISALSLQRRRSSPTNMEDGAMPVRTKRRRVQETYEAAIKINGATEENRQPALDGILEVLNTKFSKKEVASTLSEAYCYCGLMLTDGRDCKYCNHQNRGKIVNSVEQKKVTFKVNSD
ncbi:uncharacterized protein LOC122961302 isoform X1 [Acropora millepora]|uniref:uncharacterized protein LOC122961302 isoform X1 n=1 Tax=Acropora millepora TaxID=45264 RepID=UPI001CF3EAE5|nr:uncharacterized protein LOC122961302 isoform X1 [Acropora millepora]